MLGWALLGGGLAVLVLAVRIAPHRARGIVQGFAALAVAAGAILLLRRPGSPLPGHGMREWRRP